MANGGDSGQERSLPASAKRLADARKKGDVPRSREVGTALTLLGGLAALALFGGPGSQIYQDLAARHWRIERARIFDDAALVAALLDAVKTALGILAPFFVVSIVAAIAGSILLGGWVVSSKGLKPDFARMNPLKGLGRMFGMQGLGELVKGLLKVGLLGGVGALMLRLNLYNYLALGRSPLNVAVSDALSLIFGMLLVSILLIAFIGALDMPWQRFQHAKKLRMTHQEVREESKETLGNPEVKSKLRNLQQSVSQRRMLRDMVDADVVIVNPTHYAVALRYVADESAPVVMASGVDHMALRMREIAKANGIALFSAPPLARALYRHAPIGSVIPTGLYVAVAQVLAHVYRTRAGSAYGVDRASPPSTSDLPIPRELRDSDPDPEAR